jgi:predicted component of type VI protein secretion system
VLGIDDTPVPSGNELAPDTAAASATAGKRGVTMVVTQPPPVFVAPSETISTAATRSARLAVLTEPLAGHEFVLDTECCFIGRTQDNDIVLDHESVSREHAKVVRTGDRYVVVDLQSANGVRVNGVEHGQVELRAGDILTLGLVCLRFAGAEGASAGAGDIPRAPLGSRRIVALTAMLAVPAAMIIFLVVGHRDPPRVPATAALPTPVIEDFTHIREPVANPIGASPVGAALPLGASWSAAQPSAGRSVKPAGNSAARESVGRRHSAAAARDMGPGDLPPASGPDRPWDSQTPGYRDDGPPPRPSPRRTGEREIVPTERETPGKAPRPVQTPRRQGDNPARTIDTEDPYPADR